MRRLVCKNQRLFICITYVYIETEIVYEQHISVFRFDCIIDIVILELDRFYLIFCNEGWHAVLLLWIFSPLSRVVHQCYCM